MKLDYLHGRRVDGIEVDDHGPDWKWHIVLEGGAVIRNKDSKRTAQPDPAIIGTAFLDSVEDDKTTTLTFGTVQQFTATEDPQVIQSGQITLTNKKYGLAMPGVDEVEPGNEETPADTIPPDPSPDRVADGPEKP